MWSTRRLLYPERRDVPAPTPLPSFATSILTARDGLSFDVWRLDAVAPRGVLLLYHGYYANRYQLLELAERLRHRGYSSVLFELRGHGHRAGPCTFGVKETEDTGVVLQWLNAQGMASLPIGALGFSMGGAIACHAAHRYRQVRAVVVDSVYGRLFPVLQHSITQSYHLPEIPWAWLTWWVLQGALRTRLAGWDPRALAPQLRQPLLAIQGGADIRIDLRESEELFERWAGPKERWFEPGVPHVGMWARDRDAYCDRVASFFDRAFNLAP